MNISRLPDTVNKLIVLIGLSLFAYYFYALDKLTDEHNEELISSIERLDKIYLNTLKNTNETNSFHEGLMNSLERNGVNNPVIYKDSTYALDKSKFKKIPQGEFRDSIYDTYILIRELFLNGIYLDHERSLLEGNIDFLNDRTLKSKQRMSFFLFLAFIFSVFGIVGWSFDLRRNRIVAERVLIEKGERYKNCQSCCKKFSAIRSFGINNDNTINYAFYKECFFDGKFTKEMTNKDFEIMKSEAIKTQKTRNEKIKMEDKFNNLLRWKENEF